MDDEKIRSYNLFRRLCNQNAESSLKAAELLKGNKVNHIVYHLSILALEEIGKIFIYYCNLNSSDKWDSDKRTIPLDDHIKKLFWSIWLPALTNEIITNDQLGEITSMATQLHERRLHSLYTDLSDTQNAADKIGDDEAEQVYQFAKSRLDLSQLEGDVDINSKPNELLIWFNSISNDEDKRKFIFGSEAQQKLVDLGTPGLWIGWLKSHFDQQEFDLRTLAESEIARERPTDDKKFEPKWRMRIKLDSQSHSIRHNVVTSFNSKYHEIKLTRGATPHVLFVDFTFEKSVTLHDLWDCGFLHTKLFVAALNIGSNGFIYWNLPLDLDKYYENITDLDNNNKLTLKLASKLAVAWQAEQMTLTEEELHLSKLTFDYLLDPLHKDDTDFITDYLNALAILAKSDIHCRLEMQSFGMFYSAFKKAVTRYQCCAEPEIKVVGYSQLQGVLKNKDAFDNIIDIGLTLASEHHVITLKEVFAMKQYCGAYILTLAVRKLMGDMNLKITQDLTK
ncbi:AbiV family abortive infection protein [Filimonas effusa]|uniref:AbiV family abortive infection protein n=1 Tax=Filimonas effusa TaxID=2508721 RepID=A0A4Q1DDI0_9BACT|nr:AbiV family abortive infection protein [Filimonas effusa]RXK87028.1 AbiV family abortive infection protein [Filimonas effusa]